MERKVTCLITGQSLIFGKEYFTKKVTEYGSEENLKSFYCSKKAKSLIQRGFSVNEIRKVLNIDDKTLLPENNELVKKVIEFHISTSNKNKRSESTLNFSMQTSDEDVSTFINNIRHQIL